MHSNTAFMLFREKITGSDIRPKCLMSDPVIFSLNNMKAVFEEF